MIKKALILGVLLALAMVGCGGNGSSGGAEASSQRVRLSDDYPDALPVPAQLAIGTLLLEETGDAVTMEQAQALLTPWKLLRALQESGTASEAEIDATLEQIQAGMTEAQLVAIQEMRLTPASLMETIQERGLGLGRGIAGGAGQGPGGGFRLPDGVGPGGGAGPGGAFGPGAGGNPSPEELEAALAERMDRLAGAAMTNALVRLLEARAEGESLELASPNQGPANLRVVLGVVAEATGLNRQDILAQAREGKSLAEIIKASGANLDDVVTQIVQAETEQINQAIANGTLDQDSAGTLLADLETRVQELLEQPSSNLVP